MPLSVAIPTYGREQVLIETIAQLLAQSPQAAEILVVDQTPDHDPATARQLADWHHRGMVRWVRQEQPSQPVALNRALALAAQPLVLMLDDDIRIGSGFLAAHHAAFDDATVWAVAGQVLQPGEAVDQDYVRPDEYGPLADLSFPFRSGRSSFVENGMSGNLCVRREVALNLGGFDENFLPPVSYRFDTEFCKRLIRAGGRIRFEPAASIHHLRAARGGTRSVGSHLDSGSPLHGVGDYYFALRQGMSMRALAYIARRPLREVATRFHLRRPWWIPVKLVGEVRALLLALRLLIRGPQYMHVQRSSDLPSVQPY